MLYKTRLHVSVQRREKGKTNKTILKCCKNIKSNVSLPRAVLLVGSWLRAEAPVSEGRKPSNYI